MISIVIPTYNRVHLISRAIKSVLAQSYTDWELIIADDGSTDNTEEVVSGFLPDDRIKYLKLENAGATSARNSGAFTAKGKYLTFLDSDDEAKPKWLQNFYNMISNGADICCCGCEHIDSKGNIIDRKLPVDLGCLYNSKIGKFTNGGVFILPTSIFKEIGGYDVDLRSSQHSELALRLLPLIEKKQLKLENLFESLIKVHNHSGEKIRKDSLAIYNGTSYMLRKHAEKFNRCPQVHSNYLGVLGVNALKLRKGKEAKSYLQKSWKLDPLNLKKFLRILNCYKRML